MNKALLVSAAAALALSGTAFAHGTAKHSSSRSDNDISASASYTASDCNMLTVESARSACLNSIHANSGMSSDMGTGSTAGSGEGMGTGGTMKGKAKRAWHRAKKNLSRGESPEAAAQHQTGKAEQNQ
jgi:hypothetical protein